MPKILSLDVGEKRIGLAITDELAMLACPYGVIEREKAKETLKKIINSESVSGLVIGLPYLDSGNLGSQAKDVKMFADSLADLRLPIAFESEILTSVEAEKRLKERQKNPISKGDVDEMAAIIILESYLKGDK